jgi:hypothetical protein
MKEKYVKLCPRCGSTDVSFDSYGVGAYDVCKTCNFGKRLSPRSKDQLFIMNFPEVKLSEVKKVQEEIKKHPIAK